MPLLLTRPKHDTLGESNKGSFEGEDYNMTTTGLTDWLLEANTPSIRYFTLRHVLDKPETGAEVQRTRQAMGTTGPIPAILSQQTEAGHWEGERSFYTPKYRSTHWSMTLLTELGIDKNDPRFQRGIEFMLADTHDRLTRNLTAEGGHGWLCFWGNLLRYAGYGGKGDDPRVHQILDYIVRDSQELHWRCPHNNELSCAWGLARALWGLAAIPASQRSPEINQVIDQGLEFLLDSYHLVEADYPTSGKVHSMWSRLNFPLFYQTDILFVLRVIAELGALDHPGVQPALAWLADRESNGRWRGASPYRQRTWEILGDREETNRWVSLHAAIILKQAA
jgi:hypothetical protein